MTPDLITSDFATAALLAGGIDLASARYAPRAAFLASAISAASQAVGDWCGSRDFVRATYTETHTVSEDGRVLLRQAPVNQILRVAGGRTQALAIAADPSQLLRATVGFAMTGDLEAGQAITGLTLTYVNTSAGAGSASVAFSGAATIAAVAAAVSAVAGFTGTVLGNFGPWPSAELAGGEVAKGCLQQGQGASLDVFAEDLADAKCDRRTGMVAVGYAGARGQFGPAWGPDWADFADDAYAINPEVRVTYDAGWATVPAIVQTATAEIVKALFERLATDSTLTGEAAGNYSVQIAAGEEIRALPVATLQALSRYQRLTA